MKNVTVILPCLNVVSYIKQCVDSVIHQTIFDELEVLIIDAGSNDGTYELVLYYEHEYSNVRVIKSDKKSYGYQVNLGIKEATGKYVAILETDDYVREDMYEILYRIAEENDVDYIKADFERFYQLRSGAKLSQTIRVSYDDENYNRVVDISKNRLIYARDINVWKGIYKREFLLEKNVFFRESPGAAFQDIGFGQLLHSQSRRAYYIPDSLYRYRIGRENASVNTGKGICYAAAEFRRLLDKKDDLPLYLPGLYEAMLSYFCGEFSLLENENALKDEKLISDIKWLVSTIETGFDNNVLTQESIEEDGVQDLLVYFRVVAANPLDEMRRVIEEKRIIKNRVMTMAADGFNHIIFGAGNYGRELLQLMDMYGVSASLFFDNSATDGEQIGGIEVVKPDEKYLHGKEKIIIANKKHKDSIRQQLLEMGAKQENIIDYK